MTKKSSNSSRMHRLPLRCGNAISAALNALLADTFAFYLKTKNFHWHVSGPHFRDYHLLLDKQSDEIFEMTDELAERVRKIGGRRCAPSVISPSCSASSTTTPRWCPPRHARELMEDDKSLIKNMREAHEIAEKGEDVATTSLLENFIHEAEKRAWFLFEASRDADETGH